MAKPKRRGLEKGRKKQVRERQKRHLIVSNGKVTEGEYFDIIIKEMGVRGSVRYKFVDGDPLTMIKKVARKLDLDKNAEEMEEIEPLSSVWIVVDADDFKNLRQAEDEVKRLGYRLAISNPCFEVWLIDHDSPCPDSCATAAQCAERAKNLGLLKTTNHKRNSDSKLKSIVEESVRGKCQMAVANASRHNSEAKRYARGKNPGNVAAYAVWTDLPELMKEVFGVQEA